MKIPKTEDAIAKLLKKVETLTDAIGEYERRHAETWAKVNWLGSRLDVIERAIKGVDDVLPEHKGRTE